MTAFYLYNKSSQDKKQDQTTNEEEKKRIMKMYRLLHYRQLKRDCRQNGFKRFFFTFCTQANTHTHTHIV